MAYNKETGMWEGFIYRITCIENNKKYIGQTIRTIKRRWIEHVQNSKYNIPVGVLGKAIKKYGVDSFLVEEIDRVSDYDKDEVKKKLDNLEKEYIITENTLISNHKGYNIKTGGEERETVVHPVVSYDIYGNKLKEFISTSYAADFYGICPGTVSGICSGKISNYKNELVFRWKGEAFNKYLTIRPHTYGGISVDVYTKNNQAYVGSYLTVYACAKDLNISKTGIVKCCKGEAKFVGKYITRYAGDPIDKFDYKLKVSVPARPISQYSIKGDYIHTYDSAKEASDDLGIDYSCIYKVCNKKRKTAGGFCWYFVTDFDQPDKTKIIA